MSDEIPATDTLKDPYAVALKDPFTATREYPSRPTWLRAVLVTGALAILTWFLAMRGESGLDDTVTKVGRIEVTARLLERPEHFPDLGAYRYTYVLKYEVLQVHRQDPAGQYPLKPGDTIFVGIYRPWLPRDRAHDDDCGAMPVGGRLTQFVTGEAHRMALDYELANLAPTGALDYCFPQGVNRFFANWVNPTSF